MLMIVSRNVIDCITTLGWPLLPSSWPDATTRGGKGGNAINNIRGKQQNDRKSAPEPQILKKNLHCSLQLLKLIQQNVFIFLIWCSGADLWTFCFFQMEVTFPFSLNIPKYGMKFIEFFWILFMDIVILAHFNFKMICHFNLFKIWC